MRFTPPSQSQSDAAAARQFGREGERVGFRAHPQTRFPRGFPRGRREGGREGGGGEGGEGDAYLKLAQLHPHSQSSLVHPGHRVHALALWVLFGHAVWELRVILYIILLKAASSGFYMARPAPICTTAESTRQSGAPPSPSPQSIPVGRPGGLAQ